MVTMSQIYQPLWLLMLFLVVFNDGYYIRLPIGLARKSTVSSCFKSKRVIANHWSARGAHIVWLIDAVALRVDDFLPTSQMVNVVLAIFIMAVYIISRVSGLPLSSDTQRVKRPTCAQQVYLHLVVRLQVNQKGGSLVPNGRPQFSSYTDTNNSNAGPERPGATPQN